MKLPHRCLDAVLALLLVAAVALQWTDLRLLRPADVQPPPAALQTLSWEELVPKDWDPLKRFRGIDTSRLQEGDARELALMREMRQAWDNAPTRQDLHGAQVRLAGYVVPLETPRGELKEFLLVPYFGACIHTPPPPGNQIVHVVMAQPRALRMMDAVWVSGTLSVSRQDTVWGMSGYAIAGLSVAPYVAAGR